MKSKLLLSVILLTCSLLSPQPAHAWVFLNSTTFPDANFRSYISTLSGVKVGLLIDNNKVKEITYISCHDRGISSLKGIEYLTSVTRLECYNNTISSMDISKNTKLTMLNCYGNKLTSLDVSKNTALQTIYCSTNQLTSLDVTKNTALQKLECYSNSISTLDLTKNTSLNYLNCSTNSLTALDLSKNTGLTHIECQNNKIPSLDVSNHTALQYITCYNNVLTSLNVSNDNAIDTLSCHINQLTTLDLSTNTGLTDLECFTNNLTSLDLSNCPKLAKVEFNNNKLNFVDLSHNSKLTYVNTQNNGRAVTAYSYTRAKAYGGGTGYYIPLTDQTGEHPTSSLATLIKNAGHSDDGDFVLGNLVTSSLQGATLSTINDTQVLLLDASTHKFTYNYNTGFTGTASTWNTDNSAASPNANFYINWSAESVVTGVDGINSSNLRVYTTPGYINIDGSFNGSVSICNLSGQQVYKGTDNEIAVPAGLYIVKVAGKANKVIVK
jgi:hypothetical protein